jgi:DNA invertase Pin-like site-specific DNA recombinase
MVTKNIITAVGYARRSTDLQERSIPDQKKAVERWASDNGYRITRWYVDDAISGTSAKGREQFERMISDAERGRDFDAVLCYDTSRFSRGGTSETGHFIYRLREAGVRTLFTADGIHGGDEDELMLGVKSWQAKQYSVKLGQDIIRGQHSSVTERHSAMGGRAPYGYDRRYFTSTGKVLRTVKTLSDGRREELGPDGQHLRYFEPRERLPKKAKADIVRLIPGDPERVQVVRDIFEMCAKGYGSRSVVIALNERGIPGPMESRWNQMAVKTILLNPCYRGALAWNRRTFGKLFAVGADGLPIRKTVPDTRRNPADRWIVIEDVHEPLVSPELFQKAQEAMAKRRDKGGLARPSQRYLLSGLIRCTHCGLNYWGCYHGAKGRKKRYYTDAGYRAQGPKFCQALHIQSEPLDAWVLEQLRNSLLAGEGLLERIVEQFVAGVLGATASPVPAPPDRNKELTNINARIKKTIALLTDSEVGDMDELKQTLIDLKSRKQALENEIFAASPPPPALDVPDAATLRSWALEKLARLQEAVSPGAATIDLRAAVHEFVDRIEIDPHTRTGTMYMPADMHAALEASFIRQGRQSSPLLTRPTVRQFTWGPSGVWRQ